MSNFAPYPFEISGKTWPTSEHYFQAMKFLDPSLQEHIRSIESPMEAALEGRKRTHPLRSDWEEVKDDIMYQAVKAKFEQNPIILGELVATDSAQLIEHTMNDSYWADNGDGTGKNMLGLILMRVREELK